MASLLALAFSSAETGFGPSDPSDEAGDGACSGLAAPPDGGGGGAMDAEAPAAEAVAPPEPHAPRSRSQWRPVVACYSVVYKSE